jgi:hypothetical protein
VRVDWREGAEGAEELGAGGGRVCEEGAEVVGWRELRAVEVNVRRGT